MVGGQDMMHMRCFVTRLGIGKGPQCHVVGGSFRMRPHSTGIYKLRGGLEVLEERCVELEVQASEKALCTQIRSVRLYPHPGVGWGLGVYSRSGALVSIKLCRLVIYYYQSFTFMGSDLASSPRFSEAVGLHSAHHCPHNNDWH